MQDLEPDERVGVVLVLNKRSIGFFVNMTCKEALSALALRMSLEHGQYYCHTWKDYVAEGGRQVVHLSATNVGGKIDFRIVGRPRKIIPYEKFFAHSIFTH